MFVENALTQRFAWSKRISSVIHAYLCLNRCLANPQNYKIPQA
jgi:hypothetical protein